MSEDVFKKVIDYLIDRLRDVEKSNDSFFKNNMYQAGVIQDLNIKISVMSDSIDREREKILKLEKEIEFLKS